MPIPLKSNARLFLAAMAMACIAVASYAWSAGGKRQNETKAGGAGNTLSVLNVRRVGNRLKIAIKNNSGKNVNGYQISVGGARVQVELLDADDPDGQTLAPGAVHEEWFYANPDAPAGEVAILAAVFEDGTGVGDGKFTGEIKGTRAGERMQLARVLPILQSALASAGADRPDILDKVEAQILALPDINDEGLSGSTILGAHNGRASVLSKIRELKHIQNTRGLGDIRKALTKVREKFDRKLAKLQTS